MIEITPHLFIGNAADALDKRNLIDWNVNVADEIRYDPAPSVGLVKCALGLGSRNSALAVASIISTLVRLNQRVLVHCKHGMNRSVSAAICGLMESGYPEDSARRLVESKHPGADPYEGIITQYRKERRRI